MEFGAALRSARDDLGLTQPELARRIYESSKGAVDLTAAEISRYERGRVLNPRLPVIRAIAEATGRPVAFFTNASDKQEVGLPADTFRDAAGAGVDADPSVAGAPDTDGADGLTGEAA